ncbi:MAG: cell division protein ZapA [Bacteroidales bacterium]|jgi:cell division protein ZapA (FtsZ GTPase activity inhibitor)|nr:cell division protein ZapA [Bacteroidales bacterium]
MDELSITITIANRPYRLKIKKEEEEVLRSSAKKIESLAKEYAKNFHFNDSQDLIAMVALQLAKESSSMEKQITYRDTEMTKKLIEIDEYLNERIKI